MTGARGVATVASIGLAIRAGRSRAEIEAEILASDEVDEDERDAPWLYAWCCSDRPGLTLPQQASGTRPRWVDDAVSPILPSGM